jgi:small-conductance mechanosensitive channel
VIPVPSSPVCQKYSRWLGLLSLLLPLVVMAAGEPATHPLPTAPVVLDGTVLFRVRGALAYPAEERAQAISKRIAEFAADRSLALSTLRIEKAADSTSLLAADQHLATVVDADAELEGLTREQVAELQMQQIAKAVERYRHERSPKAMAQAGLVTLVATAILILLMFVTRRLMARLNVRAGKHYQARIEKLKSETRKIVQAERLQAAFQGIFSAVNTITQLVLVLVYLEFVLVLWPWTRPLSKRVLVLVIDPLQTMAAAIFDAIPGLIFIAILALITRYVLKVAHLFFSAIAVGSIRITDFEREWAWPTYRIVRLLAIVFAVVVAYPYIPGSDSAAFKGISVFLGVMFSLGSTSLIANTLAGYTLVYRRAFKIGDRVRIGEHVGNVTSMRLQTTSLCSLKNEEIVIPNSVVLNSSAINYTTLAEQGGLILHTTVGIGYETPWRQVEAMLTEAAKRTPDLLSEPPPFVLQQSLGDFSVVYELNVYCNQPKQSERLYTALHQNILDVFNEHNVQIMTPAYVGDPPEPKVVAHQDWYLPPASPPSQKTER